MASFLTDVSRAGRLRRHRRPAIVRRCARWAGQHQFSCACRDPEWHPAPFPAEMELDPTCGSPVYGTLD